MEINTLYVELISLKVRSFEILTQELKNIKGICK